MAGGGVESAKQAETIRALVKLTQVPVVVTWPALAIFESENPLYGGTLGRAGNKSANRAIREADFVLALGTRFATKAIISEKNFATKAKIAVVDVDRGEMEDGLIVSQLHVHADLKEFLPALLAAAKATTFAPKREWLAQFAETKAQYFREDNTLPTSAFVSPYEFTARLSKAMGPNSVITGDTGTNLCWFVQAYEAKIGQRCFSAWGNSPMGYALPASIGAHLAAKHATVVAITGDGGIQMNIQELQTIALHKFPIKIFIYNNDCYMNVKGGAMDEFEGRFHALGRGMGYAAPDFVKIANAYGIEAISIKKGDDIDKKIQQVLSATGPVVVDLKLDPEQRAIEDNALVSLPKFSAPAAAPPAIHAGATVARKSSLQEAQRPEKSVVCQEAAPAR
jgi:acetolactate synthase-1/2/3 large subunit